MRSSIGADPADSADLRFRKRLLVGVALIILPAGFTWGLLYWLVGETAVALTPWGYVVGSIVSLVVFARTRNFAFLRTAQLLLILIAPALGLIMIGGLEESSSVDPVVAPGAARGGRVRPPGARMAVVRRVRGHDRARRSSSPRSFGPRAPISRARSSGRSTS